jgi:hypothetical protein
MDEGERREVVDLTHIQEEEGLDASLKGGIDEMDEFDLLEATIDPNDLKTLGKVSALEEEIRLEKAFIAIKSAYRYSQQLDDPMNITV